MYLKFRQSILCASLAASLAFGNALAQDAEKTDFTGGDVSVDQLVGALDIPTRGIGAKCAPYQENMTRLTRGLGSEPMSVEDVPDLKPVKSAAVSASFEKNSARISEESKSLLANVAVALNSSELLSQCFQLAGHTCDLGDGAYNMELSRQRADSVREFLVEHGVDSERLITTGFGEVSPQIPNESEAQRERNRRVEIGALAPVAMEYQ